MKPCRKNRNTIAWLALNELEVQRARALRAHLETCAGCRGYWKQISAVTDNLERMDSTPEVHASSSFHRRFLARLREEPAVSAWTTLKTWKQIQSGWRTVFSAGVGTALLIAALAYFERRPNVAPASPAGSSAVLVTTVAGGPEPTISNYQKAISQSFEKFDELLTQQGRRSRSPGPVYRVSMLALGNSGD